MFIWARRARQPCWTRAELQITSLRKKSREACAGVCGARLRTGGGGSCSLYDLGLARAAAKVSAQRYAAINMRPQVYRHTLIMSVRDQTRQQWWNDPLLMLQWLPTEACPEDARIYYLRYEYLQWATRREQIHVRAQSGSANTTRFYTFRMSITQKHNNLGNRFPIINLFCRYNIRSEKIHYEMFPMAWYFRLINKQFCKLV